MLPASRVNETYSPVRCGIPKVPEDFWSGMYAGWKDATVW